MVADGLAELAILDKYVPKFAAGASHCNELRREPHLHLTLSPLHLVETLVGLVETLVGLRHPFLKSGERSMTVPLYLTPALTNALKVDELGTELAATKWPI